jgi:hypothetical protein
MRSPNPLRPPIASTHEKGLDRGFQRLGIAACGLEVLQHEVEGGPVCGLALEDGAVMGERTLGLAVRIPPDCGESVNPGVRHVILRD